MAYDDAILEFLAKPENLPIALEVSQYVERLKPTLLEKFWLGYAEILENNINRSNYAQDWVLRSSLDDNILKRYTQCKITPRLHSNEKKALLSICLEHGTSSNKYHFYHGVIWTGNNRDRNNPALAELKPHLVSSGLTNQSDGWPGYRSLDYFGFGKEFLLKMGAEPETFIHEKVQQTWDLFIELEPIISKVNQQLLE